MKKALAFVAALVCAAAVSACDRLEDPPYAPPDARAGGGASTDSDRETYEDSGPQVGIDVDPAVYPCKYECLDDQSYCGERQSIIHWEMTCPSGRFCCQKGSFHVTWRCLICDEEYPNGRLRQ